MFKRKVQFNNAIYLYHEVIIIKSTKNNTFITVCSYQNSPYLGASESINRVITIPAIDGITFNQAENIVAESNEYIEYIDPAEELLEQIAPNLTDEQAATVQSFYPEWDSNNSYTQGDRVRYSNGFYKCLQTHNAQESWTPIDAPSLWSAIIDATILPIGNYPLWHQPLSTNPYMIDDIVTYNNLLWICLIDNNVWAPGIYGWDIYFEIGETGQTSQINPIEGETGETSQGETGETSQVNIPEWQQPDSSNPYMRGDTVVHAGSVWTSLIDNNVWEPGVVGTESLWQMVE